MHSEGRTCTVSGRTSPDSLCGLAGEGQPLLQAVRRIVDYPAGQPIFHQGQPPFAIYCLTSGTVKVYKSGPSGGQVILRVLGAGELLGYRAVLANEPYAASAETITPAAACVITREDLVDCLRYSPALCLRLMSKLARELRISEEQLLNIASEPVRKRLARLLIQMMGAEGIEVEENAAVPAVCRRTEMAQMIGTAPETLSRALGQLARQKLLLVTRTEIRIVDPARLLAMAAPSARLDINQVGT